MAKRKRKVRFGNNKPTKRHVRYYPICFCIDENVVMALSYKPVSFKANKFGYKFGKDKVNKEHWLISNSVFRKGYFIDFTKCKEGEEIYCPKCKGKVDFRLFPSGTKPKLVEVNNEVLKKADVKKFPGLPKV